MPSVDDIRTAFEFDRVLFSEHARHEMRTERLGRIREQELTEAVATAARCTLSSRMTKKRAWPSL